MNERKKELPWDSTSEILLGLEKVTELFLDTLREPKRYQIDQCNT